MNEMTSVVRNTMLGIGFAARRSACGLALAGSDQKNAALRAMAAEVRKDAQFIAAEEGAHHRFTGAWGHCLFAAAVAMARIN